MINLDLVHRSLVIAATRATAAGQASLICGQLSAFGALAGCRNSRGPMSSLAGQVPYLSPGDGFRKRQCAPIAPSLREGFVGHALPGQIQVELVDDGIGGVLTHRDSLPQVSGGGRQQHG
jgi:hypothetical protein